MRHAQPACAECGMIVTLGEYHPYAACLMYKGCKDESTVRAQINALTTKWMDRGKRQATPPITQMNYAVVQRIRFIDRMLDLYGHIGRAELNDYFGIGAAQASRDLRQYDDLAPGNMIFNNRTKRYEKAQNFSALQFNPEAA